MFRHILNIRLYRENDAIKITLEESRFSHHSIIATCFAISSSFVDELSAITHLSQKKLHELLQITASPFVTRFRFSALNYGPLPRYPFSSYNRHVYSDISFTLPTQMHFALDCLQTLSERITRLGRYASHDESPPLILLNAKPLESEMDAALLALLVAVRGPNLLPAEGAMRELAKLSHREQQEHSDEENAATESNEKERLIHYLLEKIHEALPIATNEANYIKTGTPLTKETALTALLAAFKALNKPTAYQGLQKALAVLSPESANSPCNWNISLRMFERYHLLFNIDGRALLNPEYGISEKYRLLRQLYRAFADAGESEIYQPYLSHVQSMARKGLLAPCFGKPAADGGSFNNNYTEVNLLNEATFSIREDGKIGIQWGNSRSYEKLYAPGCRLHNALKTELSKLFEALDLEIEPGCSFDKEIILTRECSKQVMLMGLHLTPDLELPALAPSRAIGLFSTKEMTSPVITSQPARMAL